MTRTADDDRLFRAVCDALGVELETVRPRWSKARQQAEVEWSAIWQPVRTFAVERRKITTDHRRRRQERADAQMYADLFARMSFRLVGATT